MQGKPASGPFYLEIRLLSRDETGNTEPSGDALIGNTESPGDALRNR